MKHQSCIMCLLLVWSISLLGALSIAELTLDDCQDDTMSLENCKNNPTTITTVTMLVTAETTPILLSPEPTVAPTLTKNFTPTEATKTPSKIYTPTSTYTPSLSPIPSITPTLNPNALFNEDFEENTENWILNSSVLFSNSELEVTGAGKLELLILPVQELNEFYIEVDARILDDEAMNTNIVFAFGNITSGELYTYITFNKNFVDVYQVIDGRDRFISSIQNPIENFDTLQHISILYREGQLEIYLNGDIVMITQLSNEGVQLALGGQFGESAQDNAVYFDYLEVFPSKS